MAAHESASLETEVSKVALGAEHGTEQHVPSYGPPQLFVAGSAVELLQGTYGPYRDISGYYTYG